MRKPNGDNIPGQQSGMKQQSSWVPARGTCSRLPLLWMDGHSRASRCPTIAQTRICHHHCRVTSINPLRTAPRVFVYARWDKVLPLKWGINFAVRTVVKVFKRAASNKHIDALLRKGCYSPLKKNASMYLADGGDPQRKELRIYPMSLEPYVRFTMFFAWRNYEYTQCRWNPMYDSQCFSGVVFVFRFSFPWLSSFEECFWVINVEAHAAHYRMANATIIVFVVICLRHMVFSSG